MRGQLLFGFAEIGEFLLECFEGKGDLARLWYLFVPAPGRCCPVCSLPLE